MPDNTPLYRKWLWFIGLWLVGFLSLVIVGYLIRLMIGL